MQQERFLCKLSEFEGPLDLLLHLVKKAKIDLQDIFVSEITDQYLIFMKEIGSINMERASDFLNMAATLLYIKSRSLLPNKVADEDLEDGVDPEEELLSRLRAYKLFKKAGEELRKFEAFSKDIFYKHPEEMYEEEQELVLEGADVDTLYQAFLFILKNRTKKEAKVRTPVEISSDSFSIRRQKKKILNMLMGAQQVSFYSLFYPDSSQMEIAVTFVALLELWHEGNLKIAQKGSFEDITLRYIVKEEDGDAKK